MNNTNLLASLARLSINASFVIAALIYYFKQQRGLEEITEPTFELKSEEDWAIELATLTPEEIITLGTLIELFKQPTPTLGSNTTYVVTSAIGALEQEAGAPYITTPTTSLKTGEQWATQLSKLSPQNIAKVASVISYAQKPATFSASNLRADPVTGASGLTKRLDQILSPTPLTTPPVLSEELPPGKLTPFLGSPFFVKQMERLKLGETSFDRWNQEKAKLTARQAKDFEAEIKYVEGRIAELGWDDPEVLQKIKKELTPKKPPVPKPPVQPTVKPELIIERTPYPKWWKDSLNAKIDFAAPGSQLLARVTGKLRLYVSVIVITVTGETQITIGFGDAGSSGPIYLGGTDQPKGFVIAMGNSPAPCGDGPLTISATDPNAENPSIGGFATCFAVQETK